MKQMSKACLTAGLIVAALGLGGCPPKVTEKDITSITTDELVAMLERREENPRIVLLVDPRTPGEFEAGHLPGAINLQSYQISPERGKDPKFEAYGTIVVYGENPASPEARAVTKDMIAVGYSRVRMYMDGLEDWRERKLELATGPAR